MNKFNKGWKDCQEVTLKDLQENLDQLHEPYAGMLEDHDCKSGCQCGMGNDDEYRAYQDEAINNLKY